MLIISVGQFSIICVSIPLVPTTEGKSEHKYFRSVKLHHTTKVSSLQNYMDKEKLDCSYKATTCALFANMGHMHDLTVLSMRRDDEYCIWKPPSHTRCMCLTLPPTTIVTVLIPTALCHNFQ